MSTGAEPQSGFVFATCRAGAEAALKREVARQYADRLRPAFMRPGLVTWKAAQPFGAGDLPRTVLGRVCGLSLGLAPSPAAVAESAAACLADATAHLHVFPREVDEDGSPINGWEEIDAVEPAVRAALTDRGMRLFGKDATPVVGDWVLDVIAGNSGEPLLAGVHRHERWTHPLPGALPRLTLPPEAPSRTYLKTAQALAWLGLDAPNQLEGKTALELGCSPGGSSYALLRKGMRVIGVDPAAMDAAVIGYTGDSGASFLHLQMPAGALQAVPIPGPIHLLMSDLNLAPPVALRYLERVQRRVQAPAIIANIKLNDAAMEARMADYVQAFAGFAPGPVRATQLPANRQEICVAAMASEGG